MDQIYFALIDVFVPWVEDRFGRAVAWIAAAALVAVPLATLAAIAVWLVNG